MKNFYRLFYSLILGMALCTSASAQDLKISEILEQSKADLIFIGTVDSYGRSYDKNGVGDNTFATFLVIRVLKGQELKGLYENASIAIRFPGHLGFDEKPFIVFATSDIKVVAGDKKLGHCRESPCYYSTSDWIVVSSKRKENIVKRALKTK